MLLTIAFFCVLQYLCFDSTVFFFFPCNSFAPNSNIFILYLFKFSYFFLHFFRLLLALYAMRFRPHSFSVSSMPLLKWLLFFFLLTCSSNDFANSFCLCLRSFLTYSFSSLNLAASCSINSVHSDFGFCEVVVYLWLLPQYHPVCCHLGAYRWHSMLLKTISSVVVP